MTSAAIYARISRDENQTEQGVQRQLDDAHALAERNGWDISGVYSDNDISAYATGKRLGYRQLMEDAEAKRFNQIIVWQTSRLWRSRPERAAAIQRLGKLQVGIATVQGPQLDLTTAYGRGLASLVTEFDTMESEIKSERQKRANIQRAQQGKSSAFVPYGWRREYELNDSGRKVGSHDAENPSEAAVIREVTGRLLQGDTMRGILRDLNARGTPSPSRRPGVAWSMPSLKYVLTRPANIGLRVHLGEVIGKADWPGIVNEDDFARVTALLTAPERHRRRDGRRHHLVTFGVGHCGVCGSVLSSSADYARRPTYRCDAKGCVSRNMARIDSLIAEVVIERLSRPDAAGIFDGDDTAAREARERADAIRARLDTAADAFAAGEIDRTQLQRVTMRLRPELEAAEAEMHRSRPPALPDAVSGLQGPRAAAVWAALDVVAKRAVLQALGLTVVIFPRKKSGPGFNEEEIQFRWN